MENLLLKKHTQSSLKISDAIQHPYKVTDSTDNELKIEISYAMNLMGMPLDKLPNTMQRNFLIQFIRDNYKFHSVAEIRTAFTMAARGDLDCDCNHYGSFSPEYFGRIMKAYNELRNKESVKLTNQQFIEKPAYIPTDEEKRKIQREFDLNVIVPIFDEWRKTGFLEVGYTPMKLIYDSVCVFHGVLTLNKEQKDKIYQQASESVLNRKKTMSEMKATSMKEHKAKKEIAEMLNVPGAFGNEIQNECYKICVEMAFEKLKKEGKKFENLI